MSDIQKTRVATHSLRIILLLVFCSGIFMASLGVAQNEQLPCQYGEPLSTCVSILNHKAPQVDNHISNTDQEVAKMTDAVVAINIRLTEIESNQRWERALWGFIVTAVSAALGIALTRQHKK
jgi:hypothetical protein